MSHVTIEDVAKTVTVHAGAVVSKVIHRNADVDVTVFAFHAGEWLTQHTASRPSIVQVLTGRLPSARRRPCGNAVVQEGRLRVFHEGA